MKIAPFIWEINKLNRNGNYVEHILVHTGQHYDDRMSGNFFHELQIPFPDVNLGVGSGTHAEQVGKTMIEFEKFLMSVRPDWVVVVGDVNATLACSIAAKKLLFKCCHIEAGLRSYDMSMPEEINRLVTDRISDLLLSPDRISIENLRKEGIEDFKIKMVGNIMIDTLEAFREKALTLRIDEIIRNNSLHNKNSGNISEINSPYALVTLHRPSNVDSPEIFKQIIRFIVHEVTLEMLVIWPIHPRAYAQLVSFEDFHSMISNSRIILLEPLGYLEMLRLNMDASMVLTDSGGLQEECTVLGTPCLTLRDNTERPVTLMENGGTNLLAGNTIEKIREGFHRLKFMPRKPFRPEMWDGHTASRCLNALLEYNN